MRPAPLPAAPDFQALLAEVRGRMQAAETAMLAGELQAMHDALAVSVDILAELAARGQLVRRQASPLPPWDGDAALALLWRLLAQLKSAGCRVFPFAGTLLGLERDGHLLPGDKDADLAVWLEDFTLTVAVLRQSGWQVAGNVPPFDNMASLVDPSTGLSVDLFGVRRDPLQHRLEGGVWMYGRPASHQRVTHYPWLELVERQSPAGLVW